MIPWRVQLKLSLSGPDTAVERYVEGLNRWLGRLAPDYAPKIECKRGEVMAELTIRAGTSQTAVAKATYWLRRSVQRERSMRWSMRLVEGVSCEPVSE